MAIYKIFPYKDSTLYSLYPNSNFGLDAISEVNNQLNIDNKPYIARFMTQFDNDDIVDIINNKINGKSWDVNFKSFIAEAQGISTSQILELYPIAQEWENGTGEFLDSPITTNGATWVDSSTSGSNPWSTGGAVGTELFTSSFNSSYAVQGGGNWFYSGSGVPSYKVTQSFGLRSEKDINVGVKTIVSKWYSSSIVNNGFITKLSPSAEFNPLTTNQPIFKYYSVDTNTIYPPQLEFKWVDYSTVLTGSLSGSIVTNSTLKVSLNENPGVFRNSSINKFRVNVSPLYPPRVYQTASLYLSNNYLPTSSYYALQDLDTNEFIIDFDSQYTQISADSTSNYFTLYMDGLEPERYYKILIKTDIDGSTKIFDEEYYFKIVN
tara:strand:+ start:2271 stop:3404 length:1134 start_codon:yes stop_codon:yes gene_type:complete